MKQLIQNLKTGKLSLKDVPYPLCKTEGLLVKTEASLVSVGTEKSIIELSNKSLLGKIRARPDLFRRAWEKAKKEGVFKVFKESLNRLDEPFPLGYSASGVVVEVGSGVKDFKIGDKVAIAGSGYANHSEYNFVPENLCLKIPRRDDGEYLDFEEGAFCMVGGIVMQGIREAELKPGDNVAVIGLGLLGLLTVQIVRAMGCEPIGIDIDDYKIDKAQKLGCQHTLNIRKIDAEELVMSLTGNKGVNSVIITAASRNSAPIELAQKIAGQRARIILVGVCDIHLDRKYFWDKELVFKVSKAAGADDLERENIRTFLTFLAKK